MGPGQKLCRFVPIIFLCSMVGLPQMGGQGTIELSGRVINAATGEPVARALVEVQLFTSSLGEMTTKGTAVAVSQPSPVFSDATGAFHFSGLPAGSMNVSVSKPQFQSAGESMISEPGSKNVEIRMTHLGVVTGTVTDAGGRPIPGVNVILYRTPIVDGRQVLMQYRNVVTDDLGQYRLWNLGPDKYVLMAAGRGRGTMLYSTEMLPSFSASESFVPVFFGGAPDWRTASPITVDSTDEATANFPLFLQPVRRIHGTVTGAALFRNATFELFDKQENLVASRAALSAGGGFELLDILPGSYTLRVRQGTGNEQVFGEAEVSVKDADVTGIKIPLRSGVRVQLKEDCPVSLEEVKGSCGSLTLFRSNGQVVGSAQRDGQAINGVAPGQYSFTASALNAYVSAVVVGGQVVRPGEELRVSEGMGDVEVQVAQDGGTIEAKLELPNIVDSSNVQILAVPALESYSGPVRVFPGANGFIKYAPGDYNLYALLTSDFEQLEFRNPEALRALTPSATVRVDAAGFHTVTIKNLSK
jgi:Carboxypeptidase regulatory-like domain